MITDFVKPTIQRYKANISFDTKENHPDEPNQSNLTYDDIYTFDVELFDAGRINSFIRNDLMLIAGGGYETDTIKNVKINIERL